MNFLFTWIIIKNANMLSYSTSSQNTASLTVLACSWCPGFWEQKEIGMNVIVDEFEALLEWAACDARKTKQCSGDKTVDAEDKGDDASNKANNREDGVQ